MNYLFLLVILAMCGGFYYIHQQDQQQITALQSQLDSAPPVNHVTAAGSGVNGNRAGNTPSTPGAENGLLPKDAPIPGFSQNQDLQPGHATPTASGVAVLPPDMSRSSAIDSAANAAMAAQNADSLGTITTLDGRTLQNCRVLKIESDGVTFSHADGITKVLYPLLPPDMQKKFGYNAQAAVAQTEAQVNYQQQTQQAQQTASAPVSAAPAPTVANP